MGKLYMVAGPIGNLGDISLRALDVLRSVDVVFAEDTRVTKVLLNKYEILKPLKSYREAAESFRVERSVKEVLTALEAGQDVAYLSDAGTPGVSDPGSHLVSQVVTAGFEVLPIPGASALPAILSVAGFIAMRPLFVGFLPKKKGHQTLMGKLKMALEEDICDSIVFYESPNRLLKFLEELQGWGMKLDCIVGREITKMHEELVRGTTDEVYAIFSKRTSIKGEIVIAIQKG